MTVTKAEQKAKGLDRNGGGPPTKYKPEYCQMLLDYIDQGEDPTEEIEETHTNRKGESWTVTKRRAKPLRFIGRFAQSIGVWHDTLLDWAKKYEEFGRAYARAREIQGEHLLQCGTQGQFDATMAKFAALNLTDMRDSPQMLPGAGGTTILVFADGTQSKRLAGSVIDAEIVEDNE